jgi:translation initiation factor 3 subunit M
LLKFHTWKKNPADFDTKDLDKTQLERKIRLLGLATLAFQNIGRDLSYSAIAEVLQVEPTEVERWVIDGEIIHSFTYGTGLIALTSVLRTGLVVGKLSQTNKTFHVLRASVRAFERAQWEALEKRLVAWKTSLASVRDVVAATRKKNTPPAAVAADSEPAAPATNGAEAVAA